MAAWIHAPADGRHELVHVHRRRVPLHFKRQLERVAGCAAVCQTHLRIAKIKFLDVLQEGFSGCQVGRIQRDCNASVGGARGRAQPSILTLEQLLDAANAIVDLPGYLLGGVDLVDENHSTL